MGSGGLLGDPYANSLSSLMFFNRRGRRGVCDFNITHNFVLNYLWQAPTPKFGGAVAQHILGGWEFGGVIVASTGSPFTAVVGGDPLGQNSTDPKDFASRLSRTRMRPPRQSRQCHSTTSKWSASVLRLYPLRSPGCANLLLMEMATRSLVPA